MVPRPARFRSRVGTRISPYAVTALVAALAVFVAYAITMSAQGVRGSASRGAADELVVGRTAFDRAAVLTRSGAATIRAGQQRIEIESAGRSGLSPNHIVLASGTPTELRFSGGPTGVGVVKVDRLGLVTYLDEGPASVRLPALDPGAYPITDDAGVTIGLIVVQ